MSIFSRPFHLDAIYAISTFFTNGMGAGSPGGYAANFEVFFNYGTCDLPLYFIDSYILAPDTPPSSDFVNLDIYEQERDPGKLI
jgi:hypothetical protein